MERRKWGKELSEGLRHYLVLVQALHSLYSKRRENPTIQVVQVQNHSLLYGIIAPITAHISVLYFCPPYWELDRVGR